MTPKDDALAAPVQRSLLDDCEAFPDALVVLMKRRQSMNREKLEVILESVPLTMRNWRRIVKGEVVPSIDTFYFLRRALCMPEDFDKFDAMYVTATQAKKRFSEEDVLGLIELVTGIKYSKQELLDPKCFRAIAFSPQIALDNAVAIEKSITFFRSLRSLVASGRLPSRSESDRQLRIVIALFREALAARIGNKLGHHREVVAAIESIGLQNQSAFVKGALIDLKLLATNSPEEIFYMKVDRPLVDAYVAGFEEVLDLYSRYDEDRTDPLNDYGFKNTADDPKINMLRLVALYGHDEASKALKQLEDLREKDLQAGSSRFLTIYNDLVEVEARISLEQYEKAREQIDLLELEARQMRRSDLVGELNLLRGKTYLKKDRPNSEDFHLGIQCLESCGNYYSQIGNEVKTSSLQRLLMITEGVRLSHA